MMDPRALLSVPIVFRAVAVALRHDRLRLPCTHFIIESTKPDGAAA
jgi:hypothetical protein